MLQLQALLEGRQSVPPCTAFALVPADFAMPPGFGVAKVPGLVLCHVVRSASGAQLVTYWTSRTDATESWPALAAHLGIEAQPSVGAVTEARVQKRSRLATIRPGTWLLTLVALLGAVSALREHFGEWFESVTVGVTHADVVPLEVLESSPLNVPVRLLNRGRVARASITRATFELERKDKSASVSLDVDITGLAALTPGETVDLLVRGEAPKHESGAAPHEWLLSGQLFAESGLLSSNARVLVPARSVRVWPRVSMEYPKPQLGCAKDCLFVGKIYVGAGLDRLQGHVAIADEHAALQQFSLENAVDPKIGAPEGTPPAKVAWQTGPVKAFSTLAYSFLVSTTDGRARDEREWRELKLDLLPQAR